MKSGKMIRESKKFSPNMEILPLCVSDFNIDKSIVDCCVDEIAQDGIKKYKMFKWRGRV